MSENLEEYLDQIKENYLSYEDKEIYSISARRRVDISAFTGDVLALLSLAFPPFSSLSAFSYIVSEIERKSHRLSINECKKRHFPHHRLISRGTDYLENFTNPNKGRKIRK